MYSSSLDTGLQMGMSTSWSNKQVSSGLTTIELLISISILLILAAIAGPSFGPLLERWRVIEATEGMKASMVLARSEAIKRRGNVYLEKLPKTTPKCVTDDTNQDWDCGWVVFVDTNGNKRWNAGEEIQRYEPPPNLTVSRSKSGVTISLDRWGMMDGANLVGFSFAPARQGIASPAAKGLCVASGGRIRIIDHQDMPCRN